MLQCRTTARVRALGLDASCRCLSRSHLPISSLRSARYSECSQAKGTISSRRCVRRGAGVLVQNSACKAAFHLQSQRVKSRRGFQEISILCDPSSRVVLYVTNKWFKEMYAEDTHGSKGTRQCPWSRQCSVSSLIGPRDWLRKRFGVVTALRGSLHAAVRQRSSSMWSAAALFGTAGVSPGTKRVQGAPRGLLSSFQQKRMMKGDSLTRDRFVSDLAAAQPLHFAYIAQQVNTAQAQLSSYVRAPRAMRCCRPWHRTGLV